MQENKRIKTVYGAASAGRVYLCCELPQIISCVLRDTRRMAESVIIRDPEILGGEPVFRGTRVPFQALLDYIEGSETLDDFPEQFPGVTREMAITALENAKESLLARIA